MSMELSKMSLMNRAWKGEEASSRKTGRCASIPRDPGRRSLCASSLVIFRGIQQGCRIKRENGVVFHKTGHFAGPAAMAAAVRPGRGGPVRDGVEGLSVSDPQSAWEHRSIRVDVAIEFARLAFRGPRRQRSIRTMILSA